MEGKTLGKGRNAAPQYQYTPRQARHKTAAPGYALTIQHIPDQATIGALTIRPGPILLPCQLPPALACPARPGPPPCLPAPRLPAAMPQRTQTKGYGWPQRRDETNWAKIYCKTGEHKMMYAD
jgi:hypothetical protein